MWQLWKPPPPRLPRYETQVPLGKHLPEAKVFAAWHRLLLIKAAHLEEVKLIQSKVAAQTHRLMSEPPRPPRGIWSSASLSDVESANVHRIISSGAKSGRAVSEAEWRAAKHGRSYSAFESSDPRQALPFATALPPPKAASSTASASPPRIGARHEQVKQTVPTLGRRDSLDSVRDLKTGRVQSWLSTMTQTVRWLEGQPHHHTPPTSPGGSSDSFSMGGTPAAEPQKLTGTVTTDDDPEGCADALRLDRREDCFFYIANGRGEIQRDGPGRMSRMSRGSVGGSPEMMRSSQNLPPPIHQPRDLPPPPSWEREAPASWERDDFQRWERGDIHHLYMV